MPAPSHRHLAQVDIELAAASLLAEVVPPVWEATSHGPDDKLTLFIDDHFVRCCAAALIAHWFLEWSCMVSTTVQAALLAHSFVVL